MENKKCGGPCQVTKPIDGFRIMTEKRASRIKSGEIKYRCSICLDCERKMARERYYKNREKNMAYAKEYKQKNKEVLKEKTKQYNEKNRERIKERYKLYCQNNRALICKIAKEYRRTHVSVRLRHNFKSRIIENIKKDKTTAEYLGTSIENVKKWLQFNFKEDMNWDNYGKVWQIDHTLPVNLFNLEVDTDIYICFNWKNLMPLRKETNQKKHDHIWHYRVFYQEQKLLEFSKEFQIEEDDVKDYIETFSEYFKNMMIKNTTKK